MRVIYKATGQTGTIPDDKFDPTLFSPIDTTSTTTTPSGAGSLNMSQQPDEGLSGTLTKQDKSFGGGAKNFVNDIQRNVGAIAQIPSLLGAIAKGEVDLGDAGSSVVKGMAREYKNIATHPLESLYQHPVSTLLDVIPVLGGVKKLSALSKASKASKATTLTKAAATVGKADKAVSWTDKILNAVKNIGKSEGIFQKQGRRLRQGIAGGTDSKLATAGNELQDLATIRESMGLKGSAINQIEQISQKYNQLSSAISKVLQGGGGSKIDDIRNILTDLKNKLVEDVGFNEMSQLAVKEAKAYAANLVKAASKNGIITADNIFKLKNKLYSQVSKAFKKLNADTPGVLTPKESAAVNLYQVLNERLGSLVPDVREFTSLQSQLHKYSFNLAKMAASRPPTNTLWTFVAPLVPATQAMADSIGRFLQNAGRAGVGVLNVDNLIQGTRLLARHMLGPKTVIRDALAGTPFGAIGAGVGRNVNRETEQGFKDLGLTGGNSQLPADLDPETQTQLTAGGFNPEFKPKHIADLQLNFGESDVEDPKRQITPQMVMMAYLMLSEDNATKLQKAYEVQEKSLEGEGKSADQKKGELKLMSTIPIYEMLLQLSFLAEEGWYGFYQANAGKLPGFDGNYAEDMDRITDGLAKALGIAFAGESGVATDLDILRWKQLAPKPGDTYEERIRALQRMKFVIENTAQSQGLFQ